jgi:hypothetical protein
VHSSGFRPSPRAPDAGFAPRECISPPFPFWRLKRREFIASITTQRATGLQRSRAGLSPTGLMTVSMCPPRRTPRHNLNSVWRTDGRKIGAPQALREGGSPTLRPWQAVTRTVGVAFSGGRIDGGGHVSEPAHHPAHDGDAHARFGRLTETRSAHGRGLRGWRPL